MSFRLDKEPWEVACQNCGGKDDVKDLVQEKEGRGNKVETTLHLCRPCRTALKELLVREERGVIEPIEYSLSEDTGKLTFN